MTGVWGVRCRAVRGMVGLVSDELGGACAPRRVCGGPGRVALGAAVSPEKTFFLDFESLAAGVVKS